MALRLLYLIPILIGTVRTQDWEYNRTAELAAALRKIILHENLQHDKFQGKWYALAMADERIQNGIKKKIYMHSLIYTLEHDYSFQVTTVAFRPRIKLVSSKSLLYKDPHLDCLSYVSNFSPTDDSKHFILETLTRHHGIQRYSINVLSTDYDEYAVVSFAKDLEDKISVYLMLYGRNKVLSPQVKKLFDLFVKFLDLTDDNILFYIRTDKCIDGF